MNSQKLGTVALAALLVSAFKVGQSMGKALSDGFQVLPDGLTLIQNSDELKSIAKEARPALAELKDLDADEATAVADQVCAELGIENDGTVIGKAGKVLKLAARTYRLEEEALDLVHDWKEVFA
ncbi:MAG: hypothetical protein JNM22_05675 [Saprospiraceae bacterium]|nr:hypothetical protein [Saprospiraceae bacterium]